MITITLSATQVVWIFLALVVNFALVSSLVCSNLMHKIEHYYDRPRRSPHEAD